MLEASTPHISRAIRIHTTENPVASMTCTIDSKCFMQLTGALWRPFRPRETAKGERFRDHGTKLADPRISPISHSSMGTTMNVKRPWIYGAAALLAHRRIRAARRVRDARRQQERQTRTCRSPAKSRRSSIAISVNGFEFARAMRNRFERGCEAVTANYAKRDDGLVSVINACRVGGLTGPFKSSEGRAKVVAGSDNAEAEGVVLRAVLYRRLLGARSRRRLFVVDCRRAERPLSVDTDARSEARCRGTHGADRTGGRALGYDVTMLRETQHD